MSAGCWLCCRGHAHCIRFLQSPVFSPLLFLQGNGALMNETGIVSGNCSNERFKAMEAYDDHSLITHESKLLHLAALKRGEN